MPRRAKSRKNGGPKNRSSGGGKGPVEKGPVEKGPVALPAGRLLNLRNASLLLLAIPVLFNLVVLREEATSAHDLNDVMQHLSVVRWSEQRIEAGDSPLDGWHPGIGLGAPQLGQTHYLSYRVAGLLATVIGAEAAVKWMLYLLLALAPLSFFLGARLLALDRWAALAAAVVSPLLVSAPGYGWEHGSFIWRGYGMWTMLWGVTLLPVAIGLARRAVVEGRAYALAAGAAGLIVGTHFLAGYLLFLSMVAWVIASAPRQWARRAGRALIVGAGALLASVWAWLPISSSGGGFGEVSANLKGQFWADSYGHRQVLRWLFSGELFDAGRFPTVTILIAAGIVGCLVRWRRDELARGIVIFWVLCMLLFFGRPTLGPLLKLFPLSEGLWLHRFIVGVHVAGLLLAGFGAWWIGKFVVDRVCRYVPEISAAWATTAVAAIGVLVLMPAWRERNSFASEGAGWIRYQQEQDRTDGADFAALVDRARRDLDGRVYAGFRWNWGDAYKIGFVQAYAELLNDDALGYVDRGVLSVGQDGSDRFDDAVAVQYDLFNIRYVIAPAEKTLDVPADVLQRSGRHVLWEVETSGFLQVVDTVAPLEAGSNFLRSDLLEQGRFPLLPQSGKGGAAPSSLKGGDGVGRAGTVTQQWARPVDGAFGGQVVATRDAAVLLKAAYADGWKATVDGSEVATQAVEPGMVAVPIEAGAHVVSFRYSGYSAYPWLFALAALSLAALHLGCTRWRWIVDRRLA